MAKATGFVPAPMATGVASETFDAPQGMQPSFDVIEILPPVAADRLRMLRQHADDLHMPVPGFSQLQGANMEREHARQKLSRLQTSAHDDGFNLPQTDARVIAAIKALEKATAEAARISELREVRSAAWSAASLTLSNVETWLRIGRPHCTTLEQFDGPQQTLNKGEDVVSAIERHRRRNRELQADLHRIRSAPNPASFAKRKLREQVEQLAQRGAPVVSGVIEHGDKLQFQREQMHNIPKAPAAIGYAEVIDPIALVAWLLKDAVIKRLDAAIDAESDDDAALSHEAREKAEAEALSDILANDRSESFFLALAQSQGMQIGHRSDISPLALLGLRLITAPRAVPSPMSSREHAINFVGGWR
jgi:hypothetical protein